MPPGDKGPKGSVSEIDITKDLTIPKLFLRQCKKFGANRVAMREKNYGIWIPFTWQDYYENVKHLCLGMVRLGLKKGDKVAMIGDNRPEGLWAEMAALCAGAIGVWLFQDSMIDEVKYIIDHSDTKFFVGETQEEVDKALSIKEECPRLEWIIWDDPKGMRNYNQDFLISIKEVQKLGRELDSQDPGLFERMIGEAHGDDICLLFYTSGTTAQPKGALLSHWNMLTMGRNLMRVDPCYETDDFVSYLPFAWIGEQMMSISCGLQIGYTINFPEEPETALENLREIGPHVMFAPPRLYEGMTRRVQVKYIDASWIKRKAYEFGTKVGYKVADMKFAKQPIPWYWKVLNWIAWIALQKKLKDHLGMSKLRHAYTGGAAMGPDHFRFFHALGVNLKQIYGQTEIAGISIVHRDGDVKFDTVGTPIPETEVRIREHGEIISRSPSVFQGYYKNEEATRTTLVEGWLHSGDRGFIDEDGHLVVFDRSKDVMTLNDGRPFSPQYLETRLKFSPFIQEAWVIGDRKPYVTAVVCIDYSVVGKWADDRKINYTSYPELSQKPQVYELVQKQIEEANRDLPAPAKIHKFVNLYKVFDADDEELTRTSKLRRSFVEKRYKDIMEALYSEAETVHMDTTITYEDGREQRIKTDLHIQKVDVA
ncbi:MAG: AMP-binding protein [Deltaproteobacteria bacterium]|nr:AMP-binding protein [Deltaproteobacteria bacterium]